MLVRNAVSDNQLAGLGVSVYSQDEFEAGVIKRLDEEVARQNTHQQRKFAEKEIRNVQIKIRRVYYVMSTPLLSDQPSTSLSDSYVRLVRMPFIQNFFQLLKLALDVLFIQITKVKNCFELV